MSPWLDLGRSSRTRYQLFVQNADENHVSLSGFINFSLVLTLFYAWIYFNASIALNDGIEERVQISQLRSTINDLKGEKQLLSYQIDDLSFQMATLQPSQVQDSKNQGRRPASINLQELSVQRLEATRELVRGGKFESALKELRDISQKFPRSRVLVDARLLEGDVLRAQGKNLEAVQVYENVIEVYPDQVQAGVALFRLGEMAEKNKNLKEARAYYTILYQQFSSNEELKKTSAVKINQIDKKLLESEE